MIFKDIECLLIDMDGVILDNTYDNEFWQNQIPAALAKNKGMKFEHAKKLAIQIFNYKKNTKDWYDIDYWSNMLNIDIEAQKKSERSFSRIRLYDDVIDTLSGLKDSTKMILITNAHRKTLNIKLEKYDLMPYFDHMICAHELHYVKEDIQLWYMLRSKYKLNYEKTILVEDTINNINVGLSAGISGAIYLGNEDFTATDKIHKLSSINKIFSAVNYR